MTQTAEYPPGAPAWFDLAVRDLSTAQHFYTEVLEWEFYESPYALASVRGRRVAGLTEPWESAPPPASSSWTVYLSTDDIDASLEAVRDAGGTIVTERTDMPGISSTAIVRDPTGVVFALWQADGMAGAEAFGTSGAPIWAEVTSTETSVTEAFLTAVFGYEAERYPDFDFVTLSSGGDPVCGVYGGAAERAGEGHGAWLPYFVVESSDVAAVLAERAGGTVLRAAEDTPMGRWTMLADPFGAHFAAIEVAPEYVVGQEVHEATR
ncbi:VOC family protein [Nocardiopsis ansamitocini]|uniref:Hydroxylase n=1 Tax=Nocardiopsis ansamitocini TaxID=1670832 RepID=A0A9W6UHI5_9ACTN|nr:VOC family protein [Nocardiopsis ansamitocini]GLU46398.1 hydroxylase [Nocardiopsis ansamitocini]